MCSCTTLYSGQNCQYRNPCATNKCKNNATCVSLMEDGNDGYLCDCLPGFEGDLCEKTKGCADVNPVVCSRLVSLCFTGSIGKQKVKDYCPKTCGTCPTTTTSVPTTIN